MKKIATLIAAIVAASAVHATTDNWIGNSGSWTTDANWSLGAPPSVGDTVRLTQTDVINRVVSYDSPTNTKYALINVNASSSGTMTLNLSANDLLATSENIGTTGTGSFDQSGGTHTVENTLKVGASAGSNGSYLLSGGSLLVANETVGFSGAGTFTQSSGTHTIANTLAMGANSGSSGTYNLNGGTLSVASITGGSGNTTFNINGGTLNNTSYIKVNTLALGSAIGGNGSFTLNSTDTFNVGSLKVGTVGNGSFIQNGGTVTSALQLGVNAGSVGNYVLESGNLGGSSSTQYIGKKGTGTLVQNGGSNTVQQLVLGRNNTDYSIIDPPAGKGTYELNNGSLTSSGIYIGNTSSDASSESAFIQNGGVNNIQSRLFIYKASYTLNDGSLTVGDGVQSNPSEYIGFNSDGSFTQNGGTHTVGDLYIGANGSNNYNPTSASHYNLNDGSLTAVYEYNTSRSTFNQAGGTNTVSSQLTNAGLYQLSGGTLINNGTIGNSGNFIVGVNATVFGTGTLGQQSPSGLTQVEGSLTQASLWITSGFLKGNGIIHGDTAVTADFQNHGVGTISAGNSIGSLTIDGNLNMRSTYVESYSSWEPAGLRGGTLLTEIGGTADGLFDLLTVTGNVDLQYGTTLAFSFLNGFTAHAGDEWNFLAGNVTSSLENLIFSYDGIPPGLDFIVSKTNTGLKLSAVQAAPVPVPAAAWLMGSGLIGLVGISRRKK